MSRRTLVFALAACLAGCNGSEELSSSRGVIAVDADPIDFGRAYVGYPIEKPLRIENTGLQSIPIELTTEGPFSVGESRILVGGGAALDLPIVFAPGEAGWHEGVARVTAGAEVTEVVLFGTAVLPPSCHPSGPCREVRFDPEDGSCVESVAPDFSPCSSGNLCQTDEHCMEGVCVGVQVECDDENVCTRDLCDPARGCVHIDESASCPQPEAPCKEAFCDPTFGCGIRSREDFSRCGPADCREAWVCLDGGCNRISVPDGWACTDSCGPGTCQGGECERREGDVLEAGWRYRPEPEAELLFSGITDGSGHLYWLERKPTGMELVSATPGGFERYRVAVGEVDPARGILIDGDLLVIAERREPIVEALLAQTGERVWRRDTSEWFIQIPECPSTLADGLLVGAGAGQVVWVGQLESVCGGRNSWLAWLRTSDGELVGLKSLEGVPAVPPIADENGHLYLLSLPPPPRTDAVLLSFGARGEPRWNVAADAAAVPLLAWDGVLHQALDRLVDTEDGSLLRPLHYDLPHAGGPLRGEIGSWALTREDDGNVLVRSFDPTGGSQSVVPLFSQDELLGAEAQRWSEPILTDRDRILLSTSVRESEGWRVEMRELDFDGNVRRICALPGSGPVLGASSLRSDRWVVLTEGEQGVELRAWEVPHGEPAARGWVHPLGRPAGGGAPR